MSPGLFFLNTNRQTRRLSYGKKGAIAGRHKVYPYLRLAAFLNNYLTILFLILTGKLGNRQTDFVFFFAFSFFARNLHLATFFLHFSPAPIRYYYTPTRISIPHPILDSILYTRYPILFPLFLIFTIYSILHTRYCFIIPQ